jgi:large subunit ribosomal protein L29
MKLQQKEALRALSLHELQLKEVELRGELFSNRLTKTTRPLKDVSYFKKTRRDLARVLTLIRQKKGQ